MHYILRLILILLLTMHSSVVLADDDNQMEWQKTNLTTVTAPKNAECIEPPKFDDTRHNASTYNLDNSPQWKKTGIEVEKDKLLNIKWTTSSLDASPRKYKVIYRIDPRFSKPQIFIQKYDYTTKKYIIDIDTPSMLLSLNNTLSNLSLNNINKYFSFSSRNKISVKQHDVINITLDDSSSNSISFLDGTQTSELEDYVVDHVLSSIYTGVEIPDNKIVYSSSTIFCTDELPTNTNLCKIDLENPGIYNYKVSKELRFGKEEIASTHLQNKCPDNANSKNNSPFCYYDKGRGMELSIGNNIIKRTQDPFVDSTSSNKSLFYYKSNQTGDLNFSTSWDIDNMFYTYTPLEPTPYLLAIPTNLSQFMTYPLSFHFLPIFEIDWIFGDNSLFFWAEYLHMGRYIMNIEIGNSVSPNNEDTLNQIEADYFISESEAPGPYDGFPINQNITSLGVGNISSEFNGNAYKSGYLWIRVRNSNSENFGDISFEIINYTGITWFADTIYDGLVKPLRDKFTELSKTIYQKLVSDITLQNIAKTLLTLYVSIYGLAYLAGAVKISSTDIVVRILKIAAIITLFSENSWNFFNDNVFNLFLNGADFLMRSVVNQTSTAGNVFGYIDPVFSKYTDGKLWALLGIQLLQIHNGLSFFAIIAILSILKFFQTLLSVAVSYIIAFLGIAIMISLAPFFITLMLFERTKKIFEQWIALMFSYMINPTMLLIFFLLVDQIMSHVLKYIIVTACWDTLIPIAIGLDLRHIGIPISFSFEIPFFPGIPFYVPQVTPIATANDFFLTGGTFSVIASSTFGFFALSKMSKGLVEYSELVVKYLSNVFADRIDGKLQNTNSLTNSITGDIASVTTNPIKSAARSTGGFVRDKFIDKKLSSDAGIGNRTQNSEKINYNKVNSDENQSETSSLESVSSAAKSASESLGGSGSKVQVSDSSKQKDASETGKTETKKPKISVNTRDKAIKTKKASKTKPNTKK